MWQDGSRDKSRKQVGWIGLGKRRIRNVVDRWVKVGQVRSRGFGSGDSSQSGKDRTVFWREEGKRGGKEEWNCRAEWGNETG
jgi:hypothetical protein